MTDTEKPRHVITVKVSGRVDIECQRCGTGMEVSDSPIGAAMLENWPKMHKCPKVPEGWNA